MVRNSRLRLAFLVPVLMLSSLRPANMPDINAGELAPPFRAPDQFGKTQSLASVIGPKGVVLLFFRSADW